MERASRGPSLGRALDALRGVVAPQDALLLAMALTLLRHEADAEGAGGEDYPTRARAAWGALMSGVWWRDPYELERIMRDGLGVWESRHGPLSNLPSLADVHAHQLRPLIDWLTATSNPAALFEECLRHTQTIGKGGHYYTPPDIAHLLIGLLEPRAGEAVYDPVCGSGGFLLRAHEYVTSADGDADVRLYGQDVSRTALQTAAMNLSVHGTEARLEGPSSTLTDDRFPDRTFDVVVANPPFNMSGWDDRDDRHLDPRWVYGPPPAGNANFAWAQHVVSKLSRTGTGRGAILLPTGAAAGTKPGERDIRARLLEDDVLSCVVELPAGLIPHVRNPVSLWLFTRSKKTHGNWGRNDRSGQILLIDAREIAVTVGRGRRAVPDEVRERIVATFAAWRGTAEASYEDVPAWCRSVSVDEIAAHKYDVLPSHHVGVAAAESQTVNGEEQVAVLTDELYALFETSHALEAQLRDLLGRL
ncbi:N-6 DNA methylase [Streptomyces sp. MMS24-I31]|uniref:N-6 DNA methylase n=1 Tax=Streptomyces sp. MMS24-I31 TaxID=3351563 RepID=UPI00389694CA